MSVINSMLRDLERRGADSGDSNAILSGISARSNTKASTGSPRMVYIAGILGVVTVLILLASAYYMSPYKLVAEVPVSTVIAGDSNVSRIQQQKVALTQQDLVEPEMSSNDLVAEPEPKSGPKSGQGSQAISPVANAPPSAKPEIEKRVVSKAPVVATAKQLNTRGENNPVTSHVVRNSKTAPQAAVPENDAGDEELAAADSIIVSKQQRELTSEEKSRQSYANALSFYEQGDKQQAKLILNQALTYNMLNANAHKLLAMIYLENSRPDIAIEVVEKALTVLATDQSLLRLYVRALVQTGNYKQAISVMEKRLHLTTPDDLGYLAGLYQKNNDHLSAVKLYTQALQLIPTRSVWWVGQGISLEIMEKYQDALRSYQQSIKTGQLSGKLAEYAISRINIIKQHNPDAVS